MSEDEGEVSPTVSGNRREIVARAPLMRRPARYGRTIRVECRVLLLNVGEHCAVRARISSGGEDLNGIGLVLVGGETAAVVSRQGDIDHRDTVRHRRR